MSDTVTLQKPSYKAGSLILARGREWVVEPSSPDDDFLKLRPLGGGNDEIQYIIPSLETMPIESAIFPPPDISKPGPFYSARLLRDALLMKCRSGAGPFRGFGNIAVEPRAYQLVPLLMALKQDTVRLLIADDVGIGKTIEAGLIARELFDRGEIDGFSVLCPPHLVEQWVLELKKHFHIDAVAVTGATINRLERDTPRGVSVFDYYAATVISLDYIKMPKRLDYFIENAPLMIIVDEAHTCTSLGQGKQQRYELLKKLCENTERHLVMLTATPHSGNQAGFANLLALLRQDFANLALSNSFATDRNRGLREELGDYFVQRRRIDINEWNDQSLFPVRETKEAVYKLSGKWETFFEKIRSYCVDLALKAEKTHGTEFAVIWYAVIALLRCVSSSPDAAKRALETRLRGLSPENGKEEVSFIDDERADERILDGISDDLLINDEEPAALIEKNSLLESLIKEAETLKGIKNDPKLALLVKEIDSLLNDKLRFKPVVFCRYVATAHYVSDELRKYYKDNGDVKIACITGEIGSDEREEQVESLVEEAKIPVLVATDCLSEGINLQHGFDAMIHYDLAWNPARHEQREGRVDRFGQKSGKVRCVMIYGENNPVDGLIFNVIIKKAKRIRDDLGILVPIPEDEKKMQTAIVKAALLKPTAKSAQQGTLDFGDDTSLGKIEEQWQDAADKEKKNRTIFAQRSLKPNDVLPEWQKQNEILGDEKDVGRFVIDTLSVLNAPPDNIFKGDRLSYFKFNPDLLMPALKNRLKNEGIEKPIRMNFNYPPEKNASFIHRSNPLVTVLADYMLETALEGDNNEKTNTHSRCGVYETNAVSLVTSIFLIRLRHKIEMTQKGGKTKTTLAEEALLLGFEGRKQTVELPREKLDVLLKEQPSGNLDKSVIERELNASLSWWNENSLVFEKIAKDRSEALLADHRRVRQAAQGRGSYDVKPGLPVDLIGLYVLLPAEL